MKYSYNLERKDVVFAQMKDLNASFKDLSEVCSAIRYRNANYALAFLQKVEDGDQAVEFRSHNRYMGSRHELGGKKGRFPMKCAAMVRKVLVNAIANARNKGYDTDSMIVIHAAANKTLIAPRAPPKGVRSVGGNYGYSSPRRSNLELAKIEIGVSKDYKDRLGKKSAKFAQSVNIFISKRYPELVMAPKPKKSAPKPTEKKAAQPAAPKPPQAQQKGAEAPAQKPQAKSGTQTDNKANNQEKKA